MSSALGNRRRNIMQPQQTSWPPRYYNTYYTESAEFPCQPKHRRFGGQWFKKLDDDVDKILRLEKELNEGIVEMWMADRNDVDDRNDPNDDKPTLLDCPRRLAERKGNELLHKAWVELENLRRIYSQDLCLVHSLFQLPEPGPYSSALLKENIKLFENDDFGPTNEAGCAAEYRDHTAPDFVTVAEIDSSDLLTKLVIKNRKWIGKRILIPLQNRFRKGSQSPDIELSTVIAFVDATVCTFVPVLFTAMLFALARTPRLMVRIAVVGVFGLIFAASARLLSGRVSRSLLISLTAAYFAVASVFVSTTGNSTCGSS